jgi:hypothetical protein
MWWYDAAGDISCLDRLSGDMVMAGVSYHGGVFRAGRVGVVVLAMSLLVEWAGLQVQDQPKPKFRLGKETTYVTGPLDQEGYIDYEAALNERLRQMITPETNANVLLWQAWGPRPQGQRMPERFFQWLGIPEPPEQGEYYLPLHKYLTERARLDPEAASQVEEEPFRKHALRRPWSAQEYPEIAKWLQVNDKPLAKVIEATRRPHYYNPLVASKREEPLIGALLPGVTLCREISAALVSRSLLRLKEGKLAEAWQDLLASHRLARHIARGGSSIELLIALSCEKFTWQAYPAFLDDPRVTAEQLRGWLKEVQNLPPLPPYADKVDLTERFIYLDALQQLRRRGSILGVGQLRPEELIGLELIDWEPALRLGNQLYDRYVATLRLRDRAEREKALIQMEQDRKAKAKNIEPKRFLPHLDNPEALSREIGSSMGEILCQLLAPALRKVQHAYEQALQHQRNGEVALALAIYQREQGRYPERLEELTPRYLPTLPNDLFSGQALMYRRTDKGYVLYSVGVNGQDDQGRSDEDDPKGDDLVIRLPQSPPKAKGKE